MTPYREDRVVFADSPAELDRKVSEFEAEGWKVEQYFTDPLGHRAAGMSREIDEYGKRLLAHEAEMRP